MAQHLYDEIANNFKLFEIEWPKDLAIAQAALSTAIKYFEQSFVRLSSMQAWRVAVVSQLFSDDSDAFFFEAQNDLLTSHCLARCGSFRQSLKALRSAIENIYFSLYYNDHPIEMKKWELGRHKLAFTELHQYFEGHPSVAGHSLALTALEQLKSEYSTLSKAVHGSAKAFRMTKNLTDIRLWGHDFPSVAKWATREKAVVVNLNIILLHLFRDQLTGTSNRNLRETIGLVVPKKQHALVKSTLGVTIISN